MRAIDIKIGALYRHRNNPAVGFAKPVKLIPPRTVDNLSSRYLVRCEWTIDRDDRFGLIKHFRLDDLIPLQKEGSDK